MLKLVGFISFKEERVNDKSYQGHLIVEDEIANLLI